MGGKVGWQVYIVPLLQKVFSVISGLPYGKTYSCSWDAMVVEGYVIPSCWRETSSIP